MSLDSHTLRRAQAAADLANALVPGLSHGRPYAAPKDDAELLEATNGFVVPYIGFAADLAAARGLQRAAGQLYEVFAALDADDPDTAAERLNEMTVEYGARPTLIKHDGEPWHLHYHPADSTIVPGIASGLSVGLAILVGTGDADRIGTCSAEACDRAYVDISRNGTKRFCSIACQNRAKTAAFRARQFASSK